jgi:glycerol-3-phosphate dehydrogenase
MAKEWARFPDDILWRRSKLGLSMPAVDREALAAFMAKAVRGGDDNIVAARGGAVESRPIHR